MAVLDELGAYLQAQGVGVVGRDLFLGLRPEQPDECLTVAEYPGNASTYFQNVSSPVLESPQIQISSRSIDYQSARSRAKSAWDALGVVTNQTLSGVRYISIRPSSPVAMIGRDSNGRALIGFNCTVVKEVS